MKVMEVDNAKAILSTAFRFTSTDGLRVECTRWHSRGLVRGVVQIAHGMGEHIGRYLGLIEALVSTGFTVHIEEQWFDYNDMQPRRSKSTKANVASSLAVGRGRMRQVSSQSDQLMTGKRTLPLGARSTSVRCMRLARSIKLS